jgi:hypothetical protein
MHFMDMLSYLADVMYLIDRSADIVVMGIIFSSMIVGFFYALSLLAIEKSISFLPFFK